MSRSHPLRLFALAAAAACITAAQAAPLSSGIDRSAADPAVRIQDDAFRAVNGKWLATTEIPPDRSSTGPFERLSDAAENNLRQLIEQVEAGQHAADPDARRIADLYASFMDEARIEALGLAPAKPMLARIDAVKDQAALARLMAELDRSAVDVPFSINVHQDARDSTRYIVDLAQGGIGLPDRDYFLLQKDKRFADVRAKYRTFMTRMLAMSGEPNAPAKADAVFALETAIARAQWTNVENRDPVKTYNKTALTALPGLAPHFAWSAYLEAAEVAGRTDVVTVSQPTYLKRLDALLVSVPLSTWRAYFKVRYLEAYAPFLGRDFVDTRFAFVGTVLRGAPQNPLRWKRGVRLVDDALGEGLGRLYVERFFPPASKARMDELVRNLLDAYRQSVEGLDWMSPATKQEAQAKLAKFTAKVGYPKTWRDYSALEIRRDDLVGNVEREKAFAFRRNIAKLGKPIDRDEWGIHPQTINAYYNAELNEIVFPAAILQPPFFDPDADDAANYGAIGAIIGHEISHGFDDAGSQYDGDGNLRNWWTAEDHQRFDAKTRALIAQYDQYAPVKGYHVNGALTLGENIADLSGLAIATKAYHLSLKGQPAPVIDGLSGDQRFYMGFAQAWQEKNRDAAIIAQVKSDPHAPGEFRCNGVLSNSSGFADTFGVKAGDGMYRAPGQRVTIW